MARPGRRLCRKSLTVKDLRHNAYRLRANLPPKEQEDRAIK